MAAEMQDALWKYNLAKVVVIDVTDDYRLMQPPLPADWYPVLKETYLPIHRLRRIVHERELVEGFLYDWHERPADETGQWTVGVVQGTYLDQILDEKATKMTRLQ